MTLCMFIPSFAFLNSNWKTACFFGFLICNKNTMALNYTYPVPETRERRGGREGRHYQPHLRVICISNISVMESHLWPLSSTLLPLSQLLVLASKVTEFHWTMKTIGTGLLPLPSPSPSETTSGETGCYGFDIREELKGCCGYLSSPKNIFLDVHRTITPLQPIGCIL